MTSTNFCYFLQGFLELNDPKEISAKDLQRIKGHLRLAFRDDIDPSMGSIEHQHALSHIHEGGSNVFGNLPEGERIEQTEAIQSYFNNLQPGERC